MENIENLVKGTANEMEKLLASKTVVGDPIVIEGNTIIPLISLGFGFGAGGGTGSGKVDAGQAGEGTGGGTGGGGGVKPVAIIIVNQDGVRVEPVRGNPSGLERIGDAIGRALQARRGNSQEE